MDDDDLVLPHRLSRQVPVLEQAPEVEVAYSQRVGRVFKDAVQTNLNGKNRARRVENSDS